MGFNQVTWSPAVSEGALTDAAYNVPGCEALDGSISAGDRPRMDFPAPVHPFRDYVVSSVARASSIATIVTAEEHNLVPGDIVGLSSFLTGSLELFQGGHLVLTVPTPTSFTYANAYPDLATTAGTSGVVYPCPSIAQINTVKGYLQVFAYINRRAIMASYLNRLIFGIGSGGAPKPTFVAYRFRNEYKDTRAVYLTAISAINFLRQHEGFTAYAFPITPIANTHIKAKYLSHVRKALRISGVVTWATAVNPIGAWAALYTRTFRTSTAPYYPTVFSESLTVNSVPMFTNPSGLGKWKSSPSSLTAKIGATYRKLFSLTVPEYITAIPGDANFNVPALTVSGLEAFTSKLYQSNTDDHLYALGDELNLDTLLGTFANTGSVSVALDKTMILSRAGAYVSYIVGTDNEIALGGSDTGAGFIKSALNEATITLDLGA